MLPLSAEQVQLTPPFNVTLGGLLASTCLPLAGTNHAELGATTTTVLDQNVNNGLAFVNSRDMVASVCQLDDRLTSKT